MNNPQEDFSKIYDDNVEKIYRFIFIKVNYQDITEDLTSETFTRCWKIFKENPQRISNIKAFLYQVARNLVTDYYREKGKAQIISADYLPVSDPDTDLEEKALLNSDFDKIRIALTNINDDYQNVIIWHYLDELSIPEISGLIHKSEGAVRVMLSRALKSLKKELEKSQKAEPI
ncbi:MAG: RNA polymerase sigma factor [Candidatus Pacebacteria bacterium]|nr:RNA polymerase sigma factor [Candidatus Paceibacterota bacterium]